MKLVYAFLLLLLSSVAYTQSTTVVISQVYGGGSNAGATFNADFVELHNVSNTPQDISGYKILYGSATGNLATTVGNAYTFPASGVIIPAGGYLLIAASAGAVGSALPTPDYNFTLTMAGASGKIAFGTSAMVSNTNLAGQPAGSVIDFVGYGSANESETSPTGVLSSTLAAIRNTNGCTETNNNLSDFTVTTPNPRNSASAVAICGVTPVPPTIAVTTPLTAFGNVCINTTAGPNSFAISGSNLTAGDLTVGPFTGYTFSLLPAGPYVSTLTLPQTGGAYAASISVQFTPTVVQSYSGNIPVSGGGASAINVAASGFGVDETLVTTGSASSITTSSATISSTLFTGCDALVSYGIEYSTNPTFTPGTGTSVASTNLSGTSFSVSLSGLTQNTTYYYIAYANTSAGPVYGAVTSFTTGIISTGGAGVVISQVYGGGGSATGTFNADYVELHNNTLAAQDISGCKIMYGSSTGNLGTSSGAIFTFPSGSVIPSGGYVLVATTAGTGLAPIPVTADYTFTLTLSGTNGKVVFGSSSLLANTTLASQPAGTVFDFVGYGSANESETAPVGVLSATTAAFRNNNGCDDTDNNLADFTILAPDPKNSATPVVVCSALPVTFVTVDAQRIDQNKALVSWKTAVESGIRQYVVERSSDGNRWESIGAVQPMSASGIQAIYSFTDARPLQGGNYYRIRAEELNGRKVYSVIRFLTIGNTPLVTIAPNPVSDRLLIFSNTTTGMSQLQLFDASGKLVKQVRFTNSRLELPVQELQAGLYTVKIIQGSQVFIHRVQIRH
jgi:hypothetical protein